MDPNAVAHVAALLLQGTHISPDSIRRALGHAADLIRGAEELVTRPDERRAKPSETTGTATGT